MGTHAFFLKGVRNVVEAQGGIPKVAEQSGHISRCAFKNSCFSEGPLHLGTLNTILKTFGWQLSIEPLALQIIKVMQP